jgi:cell wall-associated NlpC family hydrolase
MMHWHYCFATFLLVSSLPYFTHAKVFESAKRMVVRVPVADVRAKPVSRTLGYEYDPLQETQVEKGEPVLVWEIKGKWARVECPEQNEYTHNNRWEGYPGWMEMKNLSGNLSLLFQVKPSTTNVSVLRTQVLANASRHLGESYVWGGRSLHDPQNKKIVTGVDCSGLVNWSFRQAGLLIPRDAHEQYMKAKGVDPRMLEPGDLIFLAKADQPAKIVHVAFFVGENMLMEAPQTGELVRRISFQDRFGKKLEDLTDGTIVGDRIIHFGTLFAEGSWPN